MEGIDVNSSARRAAPCFEFGHLTDVGVNVVTRINSTVCQKILEI